MAEITSQCPACDSNSIRAGEDSIPNYCDSCGYVIDQSSPVPANWKVSVEEAEPPDSESWLRVSSVRNATEKRLAEVFGTLESIQWENVVDVELRKATAELFCETFSAGLTHGRSNDVTIFACLRIASLQAGKPIPSKRLVKNFDIEARQLYTIEKLIKTELGLEIRSPTPVDYVEFLTIELDLNTKQSRDLDDVLVHIAGRKDIVGTNPAGVAAAAAYLVDQEMTQVQVADVVGVSAETIRTQLQTLENVIRTDESEP